MMSGPYSPDRQSAYYRQRDSPEASSDPVMDMAFVAMGFVFWMGCYAYSSLIFLTIRETGWPATTTERAKQAQGCGSTRLLHRADWWYLPEADIRRTTLF